jgi:tetratricopeptide (TPR) repeat protein
MIASNASILARTTLTLLTMALLSATPALCAAPECVALNNQGVIAINKKQWQAAVEALTEALTRDHSYTKAQWNLSLALHGRAVELMQNKNYSAALNDLHKAYYLDVHLGARDANGGAAKHINEAIKAMGKDPDIAASHTELAESYLKENNLIGACAEFSLAYNLNGDKAIQDKLNEAIKKLEASKDPIFGTQN